MYHVDIAFDLHSDVATCQCKILNIHHRICDTELCIPRINCNVGQLRGIQKVRNSLLYGMTAEPECGHAEGAVCQCRGNIGGSVVGEGCSVIDFSTERPVKVAMQIAGGP